MTSLSTGWITYDVLALAELDNEDYRDLREAVYSCLSTFSCHRSTHLQEFARTKVGDYEKHGHSRTYVFICPVGDDDIDVPAFFTVGMTALDLRKASSNKRKKFSGNISVEITGAYSIAELAPSDTYTRVQLPGSVILEEAKHAIARAKAHVGGRFAVVDARRRVFQSLYGPAGFTELHGTDGPIGTTPDDFITAACLLRDW